MEIFEYEDDCFRRVQLDPKGSSSGLQPPTFTGANSPLPLLNGLILTAVRTGRQEDFQTRVSLGGGSYFRLGASTPVVINLAITAVTKAKVEEIVAWYESNKPSENEKPLSLEGFAGEVPKTGYLLAMATAANSGIRGVTTVNITLKSLNGKN